MSKARSRHGRHCCLSSRDGIRAVMVEPQYPDDVTPPPFRYRTVEHDRRLRSRYGKIEWQTPYGDLPQAGPSNRSRGNVYRESGFVITVGGFVLFAGNDYKLHSVEQEYGEGRPHEKSSEWLPRSPALYRNQRPRIDCARRFPWKPVPGQRAAGTRRSEFSGKFDGLHRVGASESEQEAINVRFQRT